MKILFASNTSLAGVCELNARLVNEYFSGTHEARVLNNGPGKHRWYVREGIDIYRYSIKDPDQARSALLWADVIACQANVGARNLNAEDLIRRKRWVHIWHGAQIWPFDRIWHKEDYPYVKFTHIDQGWIQRQPEFFSKFSITVLPNLISMDDDLHRPLPYSHRKPGRVAFAPSTDKKGVVNYKGIPETKRSAEDGNWDLDVIHACSFEECLQRKLKAVLGIDEVVTPMYHRSGLEFLSQGTPCICSYNESTANSLKNAVGSETMPFINASTLTLSDTVKQFLAQPPGVQDFAGREARRWMETYYHPRILLQKYFAVYAS